MEDKIVRKAYVDELERIRNQDRQKMLRPEKIVEAAASPTNPLHEYFTWDEDEAAHRWRLHQAAHLVRRVQVYIEPLDIRVRAYASLDVDRDTNQGWRSMTDVMADANLRAQFLETALRELQSMESRYQHLTELAAVWDATHRVKGRKVKV